MEQGAAGTRSTEGTSTRKRIGIVCAYTPLPVIDAAGFTPYRILPTDRSPEQAGRLLNDTMCPHVKRVLDRAMDDNIPALEGLAVIHSCDAMRRLHDAWSRARPDVETTLIDLPPTRTEASIRYFAGQIRRFANTVKEWSGSGSALDAQAIEASAARYNELHGLLAALAERAGRGALEGGSAALQLLCNKAVTEDLNEALAAARRQLDQPECDPTRDSVPLFLFGHLLSDTRVFDLLESCGARIVSDDLCTGSRMISRIDLDGPGDIFEQLAHGLLMGPACARTFDPARPAGMADDVVERTRKAGAAGVIGHTIKFCDPYMARLPDVRRALEAARVPFLLLEGDCTLGAIGQQRTRIEAFVEMLR